MTYEGGCCVVMGVTVTPEAMTYEGGCCVVMGVTVSRRR